MKDKKLKIIIKEKEEGFILAFALIVVASVLMMAITLSNILNKELFFSRLVSNNHLAYNAADSGMECAIYLDSVFRDDFTGDSIILNNVKDSADSYFLSNLNNIFNASSSINPSLKSIDKVTCANDDNTYNQIFNDENITDYGFNPSRNDVLNNLNNMKSSFTLSGDGFSATTTFGFIIKGENNENKCVIVDFYKKRITKENNITSYFAITSTGFSSCNKNDKSRVSRTIFRYSSDNE